MTKTQLRIFSYEPNPRISKSTITARICDVSIEVRSAKPSQLKNWLWDFDAHPINKNDLESQKKYARKAGAGYQGELYKTEAFLRANPYGTVPAAFSPDGSIGLFESNSIMRAVARLAKINAGIYGDDPYSASRIDAFLDTSLLFARESQIYLLNLMSDALTEKIYSETETALQTWLTGIESALSNNQFLCGETLTLADVCFACELVLLQSEHQWIKAILNLDRELLLGDDIDNTFPHSISHYKKLCAHENFAPDVKPYLDKINSGEKLYD